MPEFEELIRAAKVGDLKVAKTVLERHPEFINRKDETGATALHYAAFSGYRELVRLLVQHGAEINVRDDQHGATPTGWAIEYLRELGGLLGIELKDVAYAIERGDVDWVQRFLARFPAIQRANNSDGKALKLLAEESGNPEIVKLFR